MSTQDHPTNATVESPYEASVTSIWNSLDVPIEHAEGCTVEGEK